MKNTTFKRSIHSALIAAALGLSVAAHAQTEAVPALSSASSVVVEATPAVVAPAPVVALKGVHIKDLKIGMVVEGPITLPGMFSVPLPIPPGKWELLSRETDVRGFGFRQVPFVNLIMGNTDPTAQQKAFTVKFNLEKDAIDPFPNTCVKLEEQSQRHVYLRENFGTTSSSLLTRCMVAYRFPSVTSYNSWSEQSNNIGYDMIRTRYFPSRLPVLFKGEGSLSGSRIARWAFFFEEALQEKTYAPDSPRIAAMRKTLEVYGEQMRRFANNESGTEFPSEYFPTK